MSKLLNWAAVILWMGLIFNLSHQPATVSNELSTGITEVIVEKLESTTSNVNFEISSLNSIVRNNAHFFIYLVLSVSVMHALRRNGLQSYRCTAIALIICILYAISDEIHQLFIPGRGAQVKDVMIDSVGASVGILVYFVIGRIVIYSKSKFGLQYSGSQSL